MRGYSRLDVKGDLRGSGMSVRRAIMLGVCMRARLLL